MNQVSELTPLHVATAKGALKAVKALIVSGADVNAVDSARTTQTLFCLPSMQDARPYIGRLAEAMQKSGLFLFMLVLM